MYYTYVLISTKDGKFYTGTTRNLKKRFEEHNKGIVHSTKHRKPFDLIYYEACLCIEDAFRREKYLKSGKGKRYLRNRLKKSLETLHLCPAQFNVRGKLERHQCSKINIDT
ncbi:MAG: GIY-YIG nuclease family protein [Candidatus Aminicenantia bacterium]